MKYEENGYPRPSLWKRTPSKLKWTTIAITSALVLLGLGLGLGLGLTLGGGNDDNQTDSSGLPKVLNPTPTNKGIWMPKVGQTWQIVLLNPIIVASDASSVTPDADIFDLDLFHTNQSTIDALHRLGKKVICYFSAGSYEPNRPDSKDFKESDKGKGLDGWPGERWLQLNSNNVRSIMSKRIDLAASKKCDAIDPDNVDAYDNKNGLGLSKADSVNFMAYLAQQAQAQNLAIGLKNAGAILPAVLPAMQFSVNEQCVQYSDCTSFSGFINASKPVFHIEYPSEVKPEFVSEFCKDVGPAQGAHGFSTVIKNMNLDGWVEYCSGQNATTPMSEKVA